MSEDSLHRVPGIQIQYIPTDSRSGIADIIKPRGRDLSLVIKLIKTTPRDLVIKKRCSNAFILGGEGEEKTSCYGFGNCAKMSAKIKDFATRPCFRIQKAPKNRHILKRQEWIVTMKLCL